MCWFDGKGGWMSPSVPWPALLLGLMALGWSLALEAGRILWKKPLLISARWPAALLLGFILLVVAICAVSYWIHGDQALAGWEDAGRTLLAAVIMLVLLGDTRGFRVIGASEESFRRALSRALERLGLPFVEAPLGIRLAGHGGAFRVAREPGRTFRVWTEDRACAGTLRKVAGAMEFESGDGPAAVWWSLAWRLLLGALLAWMILSAR